MNVAELASALPEGAAFGGGLPEAARLVFRMVRVEGAPFRTASIFQYIPGKPDIARVGIAALDTASGAHVEGPRDRRALGLPMNMTEIVERAAQGIT